MFCTSCRLLDTSVVKSVAVACTYFGMAFPESAYKCFGNQEEVYTIVYMYTLPLDPKSTD